MDRLRMPGSLEEIEELVESRELSSDEAYTDIPEKHVQHLTLRAVEILVEESRIRERRQYLFNERLLREVASLRGQLRALDVHRPPEFPRFLFLPRAIRTMIWSLAIPQRLYPSFDPSTRFGSLLLRAPVISQVCQESRAVALECGRYYTVKPEGSSCASPEIVRSSWFSPSKDILCLGKATPAEDENADAEQAARTVFLECDPQAPSEFMDPQIRCRFDLGHPDRFQRIQTVYVGLRFHVGQSLSAAAAADIFRGEEALLVDLGADADLPDLKRLHAVLSREEDSRRCTGVPELHSDSIWLTAQGFRGRFQAALPVLQAAFVECRARHRAAAGLVAEGFLDARGRPNETLEWVHDALGSVDFRPSILVVPAQTPASYPQRLSLADERPSKDEDGDIEIEDIDKD